jgi:hypothetical protein
MTNLSTSNESRILEIHMKYLQQEFVREIKQRTSTHGVCSRTQEPDRTKESKESREKHGSLVAMSDVSRV